MALMVIMVRRSAGVGPSSPPETTMDIDILVVIRLYVHIAIINIKMYK